MAAAPRTSRGPWVVGVAALLVLTAVLGAARWTGQAPFGSDNDEYQLVARQLLDLEGPVVAGVEGSKYPFGYPAVLAVLDAVGLPLVDSALALNVVLVAVAAAGAGYAARHLGAAAVVAAAGVVLLSRPLWAATQSTMPDVLLTAVVALALVVALGGRGTLAFTVLAAGATAVKSVGVLLGVAATSALLLSRRSVRALAPVAAAVGVAGGMAVVAGRYPEHTTGYGRTFWLENPYDASGGDVGLGGLLRRIPSRIDLVLDDAAKALLGDALHGPPAWAVTIALLAAAVAAAAAVGRPAAVFVGALVAADLLFLALWPYSSVRFGLPLVPVVALGAARVVAAVTTGARARVEVAAVAVVVVALAAAAVPTLRREAHREGELYAGLHAARREVVTWLDDNVPAPAALVSPDYRELALALERPVLALPYTADADDLLEEASAATHLVVARGLYGSRQVVVDTLLGTHGDRFELVHRNDRFDVYRVLA